LALVVFVFRFVAFPKPESTLERISEVLRAEDRDTFIEVIFFLRSPVVN
jgi:hypothetical protein